VEATDVNVMPKANVEGVSLEANNLIKVNATLTLNDGQKVNSYLSYKSWQRLLNLKITPS
jgi:hypothetical protein